MKNNRPEKNKSNISIAKNRYCITLENAGKTTAGGSGPTVECYTSAQRVKS